MFITTMCTRAVYLALSSAQDAHTNKTTTPSKTRMSKETPGASVIRSLKGCVLQSKYVINFQSQTQEWVCCNCWNSHATHHGPQTTHNISPKRSVVVRLEILQLLEVHLSTHHQTSSQKLYTVEYYQCLHFCHVLLILQPQIYTRDKANSYLQTHICILLHHGET